MHTDRGPLMGEKSSRDPDGEKGFRQRGGAGIPPSGN